MKAKLPQDAPVTALKNEGWVKHGENITYKLSKLSQAHNVTSANALTSDLSELKPLRSRKKYYMLSFDYCFKRPNDEVYFAYALPYTFSKL